MRAFLALPLPKATADALLAVQATLPVGRPVPEENLHLTLAYLGDTSDDVLAALHDLLDSTGLPAPEVAFEGLGTFAEMERGLVFVGVTSNPVLDALHSKVAHLARAAGATLPRRRFRPHVTVMRANRQPQGPARDRLASALGLPVAIPGFHARRLGLFQSELSSAGARHDLMADYPLG